jgi:CRP/FNR family cyclic AMP-dependent transcriptional regulator
MLGIGELSSLPICKDLTDDEKRFVRSYLKRKEYESDEIVFTHASSGGKLYLVLEGELKITRTIGEGKEHTLSVLRNGQFFGAISVIDGGKHTATVKTTKDTVLYTLTKANLDSIALENPRIGLKILFPLVHSLAGFLRAMDEKFIETVRFVTFSK